MSSIYFRSLSLELLVTWMAAMSLLILIVPPTPSLPSQFFGFFFADRFQLLILIFQAHGFSPQV